MTSKFRYVGVTDEYVECQKCGKSDLRKTIMIETLDEEDNGEGVITYYGSTCAARALGVTGRGTSTHVWNAARAAHRKLVEEAYDGRRMLAFYELPETSTLTSEQERIATLQYADVHRHAAWASGKTYDDWRTMALDMVTRKQRAVAEATRANVTVPATDREYQRFLSTW